QYLRVPYGKEHPLRIRTAPCSACATPVGGIHHAGCAVEECPLCRKPFKSCACEAKWFEQDEDAEAEEPGPALVTTWRAPPPKPSGPRPVGGRRRTRAALMWLVVVVLVALLLWLVDPGRGG